MMQIADDINTYSRLNIYLAKEKVEGEKSEINWKKY
jgi:hypothetical protein